MKKLNLTILIIFFKTLNFVLKLSGKGAGTALPGLICEKYFPWVETELLSQIKESIVITGTNGKTTTQSILTKMFEKDEKKVLNNTAGSNMKRGIISELLRRTSIKGELDYETAIYELEEATFPKIVEDIKPQIIVVTNLFRDQLDAYGEIDQTQKYIVEGINKMPKAKIVLNFDDPKVKEISTKVANETYFISLGPEIAKAINYEDSNRDLEHIQADYKITAKHFRTNEELENLFDAEMIEAKSKTLLRGLILKTPGKFQIYNALSAIAAARIAGLKLTSIRKGLDSFKPAFGRGESISKKIRGKNLNFKILLVKNPAGCSLNLELIKNIPQLRIFLLLNDNIADGKDVSWIWDSEFEKLNGADIKFIAFSGKRAQDMQTRVKYALQTTKFQNLNQVVENDIKQAINKIGNVAKDGETIYVLPTYTAMLEFRKILGKNLE